MQPTRWLWATLSVALGCTAGGAGTGAPQETDADHAAATDGDGQGSRPSDQGDGSKGDGSSDEPVGSDGAEGDSTEPTGKPFEGDPQQLGGFMVLHDANGLTIPNPGQADINAGLFVPSIDGASPASGKFPLVVGHPGFGAQWTMYTELYTHLASWGYVVVAINHAGLGQDHMLNAEQTLRTIEWASSDESPMHDAVDPTRVATVGHSMGGKIALLAAYLDAGEHIKAIIGWDPVTAGGPMSASDPTVVLPDKVKELHQPKLLFGATDASCSPAGGNAKAIFEAVVDHTVFFTFPMANHMDWVDVAQNGTIGGVGGAFCGGPMGIPMDVHRITSRTEVAFLKQALEGYDVDAKYFDPASELLKPDVERGLISVQAK